MGPWGSVAGELVQNIWTEAGIPPGIEAPTFREMGGFIFLVRDCWIFLRLFWIRKS
jgi:hypothetical protein